MNPATVAMLSLCTTAVSAAAGPTLPDDFEAPGTELAPLSSYFGGVGGFGTRFSDTTVFDGRSLEVWINFRPDAFFGIAGATFGSLELTRANLDIPADADTFSITVSSPAGVTLSVRAAMIEDDNDDGVLDAEGGDDEWETAPTLLAGGSATLNIPITALELTNPGEGNGLLDLATTPRLAFKLTFETRRSYPGGMITAPVTLLVDHVGFFRGSQSPPPACGCAADYNQDGGVDGADVEAFFTAWAQAGGCSDINQDGGVDGGDVEAFFTAWQAGAC